MREAPPGGLEAADPPAFEALGTFCSLANFDLEGPAEAAFDFVTLLWRALELLLEPDGLDSPLFALEALPAELLEALLLFVGALKPTVVPAVSDPDLEDLEDAIGLYAKAVPVLFALEVAVGPTSSAPAFCMVFLGFTP